MKKEDGESSNSNIQPEDTTSQQQFSNTALDSGSVELNFKLENALNNPPADKIKVTDKRSSYVYGIGMIQESSASNDDSNATVKKNSITKKPETNLWIIFIIAISIIALFKGCAPPPMLNATLNIYEQTMVLDNKESFDLQNTEITINSLYKYKPSVLKKGKNEIYLDEFSKTDGERFNPMTFKVKETVIWVYKSPRGDLSTIYDQKQ